MCLHWLRPGLWLLFDITGSLKYRSSKYLSFTVHQPYCMEFRLTFCCSSLLLMRMGVCVCVWARVHAHVSVASVLHVNNGNVNACGFKCVTRMLSCICRHPDKNKDPSANEKFMKINEAYEVLFFFFNWVCSEKPSWMMMFCTLDFVRPTHVFCSQKTNKRLGYGIFSVRKDYSSYITAYVMKQNGIK